MPAVQMKSSDVQSRITDLFTALRRGPVEIVRYDVPQAVALSPEAYAALKAAANEGLVARIRAAEAEGYLSADDSGAVLAAGRAWGYRRG